MLKTHSLTPEGNLQLPLEIRDRFSNGEEYLFRLKRLVKLSVKYAEKPRNK